MGGAHGAALEQVDSLQPINPREHGGDGAVWSEFTRPLILVGGLPFSARALKFSLRL